MSDYLFEMDLSPVSDEELAPDSEKIACQWGSCSITCDADFLWPHIDLYHFTCCDWKDCQKLFPSEMEFKSHVSEHVFQMYCVYCDSRIRKQSSLQEHLSVVHNLEMEDDFYRTQHQNWLGAAHASDSHTCHWNNCSHEYNSENNLLKHVLKDHVGAARKCEWKGCDHVADHKVGLKSHAYNHTITSSYGCFLCKSTFEQYSSFFEHLTSNHGETYWQYSRPRYETAVTCLLGSSSEEGTDSDEEEMDVTESEVSVRKQPRTPPPSRRKRILEKLSTSPEHDLLRRRVVLAQHFSPENLRRESSSSEESSSNASTATTEGGSPTQSPSSGTQTASVAVSQARSLQAPENESPLTRGQQRTPQPRASPLLLSRIALLTKRQAAALAARLPLASPQTKASPVRRSVLQQLLSRGTTVSPNDTTQSSLGETQTALTTTTTSPQQYLTITPIGISVPPSRTARVSPLRIETTPRVSPLKIETTPRVSPLEIETTPRVSPLKIETTPRVSPLKIETTPRVSPLKMETTPRVPPLRIKIPAQSSPQSLLGTSLTPLVIGSFLPQFVTTPGAQSSPKRCSTQRFPSLISEQTSSEYRLPPEFQIIEQCHAFFPEHELKLESDKIVFPKQFIPLTIEENSRAKFSCTPTFTLPQKITVPSQEMLLPAQTVTLPSGAVYLIKARTVTLPEFHYQLVGGEVTAPPITFLTTLMPDSHSTC